MSVALNTLRVYNWLEENQIFTVKDVALYAENKGNALGGVLKFVLFSEWVVNSAAIYIRLSCWLPATEEHHVYKQYLYHQKSISAT